MNLRRLLLKWCWIAPLLILVLAVAVRPVLAHGYIVRSIPEDRSVLERAPTRLQYWFSEGLEPRFSRIKVTDQTGQLIAEGGVSEDDSSLLMVRLPSNLPDGAYVAELRPAFATDGHVVVETRVFFIGQEVGGVVGSAASQQANLLEALWRVLVLTSAVLLFGLFTLYSGILIPAWGNPAYRAGLLPPRVMRRLSAIIIIALAVAFVGNILAIIQQAMVFFNADFARVIEQGLWQVVRIGSRFGDLWNARILFLLITAALHGAALHFRAENPETVRPFWTASAWSMALVIGTFSVTSHAAGSLLWPWVGIVMDWLHALGAGLWVGGLAALVLVLPPALAPYQADERRLALLAVLNRFSRLAALVVFVVIATGIYSASNWVDSPTQLIETGFGKSLLLKLLMVAALLLLGLAHYAALHPGRFQRAEAIIRAISGFMLTLRLEVAAALLVLGTTALLSATPVPVPEFAAQTVPAPTQTITLDDVSITLTLTPGGPGINTYDVLILQDGQPLPGAQASLQISSPTRDWRGRWEMLEGAEDGIYVTVGDEINTEGAWWSQIALTLPDGKQARTAAAWDISIDAAVPTSRPPNLVNGLALGGVIAALAWALYQPVRRFYKRLDINPTTVTITLGAVVMTVIFTLIGAWWVQDTQVRYDATINPPPQIINTVLPDAASLTEGQRLLEQLCPVWQDSADFNTLVERLPRTRDEELFNALREGWRDLPACAPDDSLQDFERWHIVNYLRTFEI